MRKQHKNKQEWVRCEGRDTQIERKREMLWRGRERRRLKSFPNKKKSYNSDKILCVCIFSSYIIESLLLLLLLLSWFWRWRGRGRERNTLKWATAKPRPHFAVISVKRKMFLKSVFLCADVSCNTNTHTYTLWYTLVHQMKAI